MTTRFRYATALAIFALLAPIPAAEAGGLGKVLGTLEEIVKKKTGAPSAPHQSRDLNDSLLLLPLVTIATDQGMRGLEALIGAFPDDRVAGIRQLAMRYHELSSRRGNANIDAEQFEIAGAAAAEAATLQIEWSALETERTTVVRKAYLRLGLMIAIDTYAATKLPGAVRNLRDEAQRLDFGNPGQVVRLVAQVGLLGKVMNSMPTQIESFSAVRRTARALLEAKGMSLGPDPSPSGFFDVSSVESRFREIELD